MYKLRWPDGFICPKCGYNKCCQLTQRSLQQCHKCHHQTSITAEGQPIWIKLSFSQGRNNRLEPSKRGYC
ncbi:transposase [Zooshikella sp. WH53]|uniref:Transposase n=1 Tax=Zooshikella harenae TaxID=2827238 RepID=A0ABS5ZJ09_9GAMM|nr:transposase [Zooshikella harenae]